MLSIIYSDEFLNHDTGSFHPEKPQRLSAIVKALKTVSWSDQIQWQLPTPITKRDVMPWLTKLHEPEYIARVKEIAHRGGGSIDPDTPVSPQSYEIALLAVNAWLDGVETVLTTHNPTFVLARPPGHHATRHTGMGFCLFSNAAIAAHYALEKPGIQRVAILDWDVHHGNGTQNIVENNPNIAYCSLHQSPCYPGTGRPNDRGAFRNVLNIPVTPGSTIKEYQHFFDELVMPFLSQFKPDFLIISAGYDANDDDPLAGVSLQPEDFGIFTEYARKISDRLLFGLEGGYNLEALAQSVIATLEPCLNYAKI
jgi:acetoin utilization deacetylase AcuC-like enzyme